MESRPELPHSYMEEAGGVSQPAIACRVGRYLEENVSAY